MDKTSVKEGSYGHSRIILGCSLVSKDSQKKIFLGLDLLFKRPNVKLKMNLDFFQLF